MVEEEAAAVDEAQAHRAVDNMPYNISKYYNMPKGAQWGSFIV